MFIFDAGALTSPAKLADDLRDVIEVLEVISRLKSRIACYAKDAIPDPTYVSTGLLGIRN